MRSFTSAGVGALIAMTAACGGEDSPGGGPGGSITGRERIGWDQQAISQQELTGLRYILWIDDVPGDMSGVTCESWRGGVSPCSGALRSMPPGTHELAISAVAPDGTQSPRSASLSVTVTRSNLTFNGDLLGTPTTGAAHSAVDVSTSAGLLRVEALTDALTDVTDLAVTDDGRVFVAERGGTVRVWADGALRATPALVVDDLTTEGKGGLLSVALSPDFDRTGHAFVAYTAPTGFRIARYRDAGGSWAERAVVFETQPESVYTAAVARFGPDGRLYVALDDEGDAAARDDLGTFGGKVLRLNPDGSVPDDQPGFSPVHVTGVRQPRGLTWAPAADRLWIANGGRDDREAGTIDVARRTAETARRGARRTVVARFALPEGDAPAAAILYRGEAFKPWEGDLLVSLQRSGQLWRLDVDAADPDAVVASEILLDGSYGPLRAMTVASDGSVFAASERRLLRLMSPTALP